MTRLYKKTRSGLWQRLWSVINNKVGFHETFEQLCFLDKYRIAENIYLSVLIDIQKHWLMQAQTYISGNHLYRLATSLKYKFTYTYRIGSEHELASFRLPIIESVHCLAHFIQFESTTTFPDKVSIMQIDILIFS